MSFDCTAVRFRPSPHIEKAGYAGLFYVWNEQSIYMLCEAKSKRLSHIFEELCSEKMGSLY